MGICWGFRVEDLFVVFFLVFFSLFLVGGGGSDKFRGAGAWPVASVFDCFPGLGSNTACMFPYGTRRTGETISKQKHY